MKQQQLPAKYAKMTVCTFWILKQLKSMGIMDEEKMGEMAEHFHLFRDNEDQMLFFKDLVENFKEHENYLKMYASARNLEKHDDDEYKEKETDKEKETEKDKQKEKEKEKQYAEMPAKMVVIKKELTEAEMIQQLLFGGDIDDDLPPQEEEEVLPIVVQKKPKIKLVVKKN